MAVPTKILTMIPIMNLPILITLHFNLTIIFLLIFSLKLLTVTRIHHLILINFLIILELAEQVLLQASVSCFLRLTVGSVLEQIADFISRHYFDRLLLLIAGSLSERLIADFVLEYLTVDFPEEQVVGPILEQTVEFVLELIFDFLLEFMTVGSPLVLTFELALEHIFVSVVIILEHVADFLLEDFADSVLDHHICLI